MQVEIIRYEDREHLLTDELPYAPVVGDTVRVVDYTDTDRRFVVRDRYFTYYECKDEWIVHVFVSKR